MVSAKFLAFGTFIAIRLMARAYPILTTRSVFLVRVIETKKVIEEPAASLGQSVSDFAVSTLVHQARSVIEQRNVTT
jgi:uncharacterized protein (DUF1778 family)